MSDFPLCELHHRTIAAEFPGECPLCHRSLESRAEKDLHKPRWRVDDHQKVLSHGERVVFHYVHRAERAFSIALTWFVTQSAQFE